MKIVDLANEIWIEQGMPTTTSIAAIAFFLRANVSKLNLLLYEDFWVEPTTLEIRHGNCLDNNGNPKYIGRNAASIFKLMYLVYQANLDIRNMLNSVITDSVLKATDQEFSIEKVNKSELLKTLTALKKDTLQELQMQIHFYRSYHGQPQQVASDDCIPGHFEGVEWNGYIRPGPI
jgi:hypothetical protein